MSWLTWLAVVAILVSADAGGESALADRAVDAAPGEQLVEHVSDEDLLQDADVDSSGFVGMKLAMALSEQEHKARASLFETLADHLAQFGFSSVDVPGDGSCQFHAVVLSAGLDMSAADLRKEVIAHMAHNPLHDASFVHGGDWSGYLERLKLSTTLGHHMTLTAVTEILGRPIVVHSSGNLGNPMVIPVQMHDGEQAPAPIKLAFDPERHYQAVVEMPAVVGHPAVANTAKRRLKDKCPRPPALQPPPKNSKVCPRPKATRSPALKKNAQRSCK